MSTNDCISNMILLLKYYLTYDTIAKFRYIEQIKDFIANY